MSQQSIFITGGGSGIGRATALLFARKGWRIGLADVSAAGLAETAALLPDRAATARLLCKQDAVICGRPWFDACHRALDPAVRIDWHVAEGDRVAAGGAGGGAFGEDGHVVPRGRGRAVRRPGAPRASGRRPAASRRRGPRRTRTAPFP